MIEKPKRRKQGSGKRKAWNMFSRYIRIRDCLATTGTKESGRCVTCNRIFSFKELQAGHGLGGRNNSILFDEELVNAQCGGCNGYGNGQYGRYSLWFIKKYGLKRWEEKVILSNQVGVKIDYEEKYQEFKRKLEELEG